MKSTHRARLHVLLALFCCAALTGCGGGGGGAPAPGSSASPSVPSGLAAFGSDAQLEHYLKDALSSYDVLQSGLVFTNGGAVPTMATDASGRAAVSVTNLQEADVDEADRVKSDGTYLYAAPASTTSVWAAKTEGSARFSDSQPFIRVLRLTAAPAATQVTTVALPLSWSASAGMYLVHDRAAGRPPLLVAVGSSGSPGWSYWGNAWSWAQGSTEVTLFDLSTPSAPVLLTRLSMDGHLLASRRIGDTLHLVTRHTPRLTGLDLSGTPAAEAANRQLLEDVTLNRLLPGLTVNGGTSRPLLQSQQCFLPGRDSDARRHPTMVTVTSIDLASPEQPVSSSIVGETDTVYVSAHSLFLATLVQGRGWPMWLATTAAPAVVSVEGAPVATASAESAVEPDSTDLHRFELTASGVAYRASTRVEGSLGWDAEKRPFRFSEHEGVLRVVLSLGNEWSGSSTTRLLLLGEEPTRFTELSRVSGIGLTGERLYASRFDGPTAYLVTFRVTDPLYVYDLSDPRAPRLSGELKIDGYSDYLHPIGSNYLLGIGKDAVPDVSSSDFGGRGAWYQGVKLTLFDVSVPASPREVRSVVVGKRGTNCGVASDHHAFAFLPEAPGRPARIAVPVDLASRPPSEAPTTGVPPWTYYGYTHTGLYLFEVTTGAGGDLRHHGTIVSEEASLAESLPHWYGPASSIAEDRAVLTDANVHYVHGDQVWSAPWTAPTSLTGPQ
jgi:hypothetical protein